MPKSPRKFAVGEMVYCRDRVCKVVKEMSAWNRYELEDCDGERVWKDGRTMELMPSVVIAWDDRMSRHALRNLEDGTVDAPERHDRCSSIWQQLKDEGLVERCRRIDFEPAGKADVCLFHTPTHYDRVMMIDENCLKDEENLAKTLMTDGSPLAARLAVGCVIAVMREVIEGAAPCGLALVRPPGHHALHNASMGFCLFNNVVIAAQVAQRDYGVPRILILDWDVHHGNGIQDAFYDNPNVMYISLHVIGKVRGRFYPGTGGLNEIGEGAGKGYNINIGWRQTGVGDDAYKAAFEYVVMPIAHEFNPDLVFVSAGFDAGEGDPLGECKVSPDGFSWMTKKLLGLAAGRVVVALEGGYSLATLARCSCAVVSTLQTDGILATALVPAPPTPSTVGSPVSPLKPRARLRACSQRGGDAASPPATPASPASPVTGEASGGKRGGYCTYPRGERVEERNGTSAFAGAHPQHVGGADAEVAAALAPPVSPSALSPRARVRGFGGGKADADASPSPTMASPRKKGRKLAAVPRLRSVSPAVDVGSLLPLGGVASPVSPATPGAFGLSWGRGSSRAGSPCGAPGWEGITPPSTPLPRKYTAFPPKPEFSLSDCSASCFAVLVDTARMLAPHWPCLEEIIPKLQQAEEEVRDRENLAAMMEARRRREAEEEEAATANE